MLLGWYASVVSVVISGYSEGNNGGARFCAGILVCMMNRVSHVFSSAKRFSSQVGRELSERAAERRLDPKFMPSRDDGFVVGVYHAGDRASTYQLKQWLAPIEDLAATMHLESGMTLDGPGDGAPWPVGILMRNLDNAREIAQLTELPVRYARLTSDVDRFMTQPTLCAVLYVNQAVLNFQALRYPGPAHVHLSHGESEKISMVSNQLKAYDCVFTAGLAARERIEKALLGRLPDMIDVGRPQLDYAGPVPERFQQVLDGSRPTVFYAPTWEGDSPSMAYGTLAQSGVALVEGLVEAGFGVIYRPHPRTGVVKPEFARADAQIRELVAGAAGCVFDDSPTVSWQFAAADACVAEMSSVAFDWLSTHKPLVGVAPTDPGAEVPAGGLFSRVLSVVGTADGGRRVSHMVRQGLDSGESGRADREKVCRYYLGDTGPGSQRRRFVAAVASVVEQRWADRQLTDFS